MFNALQEAEIAYAEDEVPIGSVVVFENKIIGRGHNQTLQLNDPTAHAEILAITAAANYLKSPNLENCEIYISSEPCVMCAGAILNSKIKNVFFGCFQPNYGAAGSIYNLLDDNKYNYKISLYSGIYAEESKKLLQSFFQKKRINLN